ncbi:MAG TPA: hypothetical protein VGG61_08905 [Gemmataceae bacterium]|jgi:hypothetical protein
MNHRTGSCLLALTWSLLVGVAVPAQTIKLPDRPSHLPLPAKPGIPEVSPDGIQGQLDQIALEELLRRALKNPEKFGLKKDDLPAGMQKSKLDPNDPLVKSLLEKLYKPYEGKNPAELPKGATTLTPEQLEQLRKAIAQFHPPNSANGNAGGSGPDGSGGKPADPVDDQGHPKLNPSTDKIQKPFPQPTPPETDGQSDPKSSESENKESETKKALAKAVETFKESGSFTKAIQSLSDGDENGSSMLNRWEDESESEFDWARFGKETGIDRLEKWLPDIDWSNVASKMPSMSDAGWNVGGTPNLPAGATGLETGSSILTVFLVLLLLVVFGIAIWKFRSWFALGGADSANGHWQLGPWPVQPAMVCTREELIRAFEYLSVLRLGRTARNWNHRHIAAELSQTNDIPAEGTEAATRLAAVYEHARYAPAADPLADQEFEAARRDLCVLAGVPGA